MKNTPQKIALVYRKMAEFIDRKTFEWIGKPWLWFIVGILSILTGIWLFRVGRDMEVYGGGFSALEGKQSEPDALQGIGLVLMIFGGLAMKGERGKGKVRFPTQPSISPKIEMKPKSVKDVVGSCGQNPKVTAVG